MTFAACADHYLAEHIDSFRNEKHRWQWRETLSRACHAFDDLNVAQIDAPVVIKFLTPIWHRTAETGSRTRQRVEKVLDWAKVHRFRDGENLARWKGHLEHVFAAPKSGNFAAMPFAELPTFMASLRQRQSSSARAPEFVILTATRSGEVRGATWREIDLDKKLWTIPAERMKAGKQHEVPLSKQAVKLLRAMPHIEPYVFPGAAEGKPLSDMALMQLLKGMDANGYTVHGFRSTFNDWAADLGQFDREVVQHALAHKLLDRVEAAYRRGTALKKRRTVDAVVGELLRQRRVGCQRRTIEGMSLKPG